MATTQQDLSYWGEREILWQGEMHAEESPLMLVYVVCEHQRMLQSTLCLILSMCSFYMSFSSRVFPLVSYSPLLFSYTLGFNLGRGMWQSALDIIISLHEYIHIGCHIGLHALSVLSI
jgi:hypothetical protein